MLLSSKGGRGIRGGPAATGDVHEGYYVKDKRQGWGMYTWLNGDKYVGLWFDGLMHGVESLNEDACGQRDPWHDCFLATLGLLAAIVFQGHPSKLRHAMN